MAEVLTESFCERCGSRYTFESATPRVRLRKLRVMSRGLKTFVLDDKTSLDEAMAAARSDTDRDQTSSQLDAFHKTFNFCMQCRQYTCPKCWNESVGRCLTCAPDLDQADPSSPFPARTPTILDLPGDASPALPSWAQATDPHVDHEHAGNGHEDDDDNDFLARLDAMTAPGPRPEPRIVEAIIAEPEPVVEPANVAPATAEAAEGPADLVPADLLAGQEPGRSLADALDAFETAAVADAGPTGDPVVEPEPVIAAEPEIEPIADAPAPVSSEAEPVAAAPVATPAMELEPTVVQAEPEPEPEIEPVAAAAEPMFAEREPAPEPIAATADPVVVEPDAEPEPIAVAREPIIAEPEPIIAEPEPVAAAPEPEPVAAAAEPEPVVVEPAPSPTPVDIVAQPTWSTHLPEPAAHDPATLPAAATATPEWPVRPEWPAQAASPGLPFLNRPVVPTGGVDALWAESDRAVTADAGAARANIGVQPCVSCGLSLSATARFCRRCGSAQA